MVWVFNDRNAGVQQGNWRHGNCVSSRPLSSSIHAHHSNIGQNGGRRDEDENQPRFGIIRVSQERGDKAQDTDRHLNQIAAHSAGLVDVEGLDGIRDDVHIWGGLIDLTVAMTAAQAPGVMAIAHTFQSMARVWATLPWLRGKRGIESA